MNKKESLYNAFVFIVKCENTNRKYVVPSGTSCPVYCMAHFSKFWLWLLLNTGITSNNTRSDIRS